MRDDGYFFTRASKAPSATANLIGQCGEWLCFQDSKRFYVWNTSSEEIEKRIGFDAVQFQGTVAGFGRTQEGDWRIVLVAKTGNTFSTRVYRSENDHRVAIAGQEEEANIAADGANQEDGWSVWQTFGQHQAFTPSQFQLARFSVSEDDGGAIYWAGKIGGDARIVRFRIANEEVGLLNSPVEEDNALVTIGDGFNGELAATVVHRLEAGFSLGAWSRRGPNWVPIATIQLQRSQLAISFVPLSFFNGRLDNRLNLLFLKDGVNVIRMRPDQMHSASEVLFKSKGNIEVSASTLPPQRYPFERASLEKHRTPEEDEQERARKKLRMSRTTCFDSFNPDSTE